LTAILIIAMAVYPRTRDFPRNLIIMTAAAANIAVRNSQTQMAHIYSKSSFII